MLTRKDLKISTLCGSPRLLLPPEEGIASSRPLLSRVGWRVRAVLETTGVGVGLRGSRSRSFTKVDAPEG